MKTVLKKLSLESKQPVFNTPKFPGFLVALWLRSMSTKGSQAEAPLRSAVLLFCYNLIVDLKELVNKYLTENTHMQLATVRNGQPWICTLYFVADNEFNLYWTSGRDRQHSLEIVNDPRAAVTVVRDTERKQALQITGNAFEVNDDDIDRVHSLYTAKFGPKDYDLEEMKRHKPQGRGYWVFNPNAIWLWDEVNFPDSPKQKYISE